MKHEVAQIVDFSYLDEFSGIGGRFKRNKHPGQTITEIDEKAYQLLSEYNYPKKFRELEAIIRNSCRK